LISTPCFLADRYTLLSRERGWPCTEQFGYRSLPWCTARDAFCTRDRRRSGGCPAKVGCMLYLGAVVSIACSGARWVQGCLCEAWWRCLVLMSLHSIPRLHPLHRYSYTSSHCISHRFSEIRRNPSSHQIPKYPISPTLWYHGQATPPMLLASTP
jgi:hypothetical protein